MILKECFHFTKLDKSYSIRDTGLQARLGDNSKAVGDNKAKVSYSVSKVGAIGLFANFFEVYSNYKTGIRKPREDRPEEMQIYNEIMKSSSFEEFLGNGMYLIFEGDGIENTGGNTGRGGIYDASTTDSILPEELKVGVIRNNDTGEITYSKFEYIHFLMSTMTQDEFSQMLPVMQEKYKKYYEEHKSQIEVYRHGNFSETKVSIFDFCRLFKCDIDKAIEESSKTYKKNSWDMTPDELDEYNKKAKEILSRTGDDGKQSLSIDELSL